MRWPIVALSGLFAAILTINLGCGGGATIPEPPAGAKAGPPPGTSPEMTRVADPKAGKK